MAYASWSVVFGEQPSTAKWNILGTNDSSFNDGTGIGTNAIAAASLATNAITLGYASSTSNFTTSSATAAQVTGLTLTVTIPSGSRRIRITGYTSKLFNANTNATSALSIWDGTPGSGTQLADGVNSSGTVGSDGHQVMVQAIVSPSAGSKTYNIGASSTSGANTTVTASATSPSFILVEVI